MTQINQKRGRDWPIFKRLFDFIKYGQMPASFWFIFVLFSFPQQVQFHFQQYRLKKAQMVCLEFKAEAAGW